MLTWKRHRPHSVAPLVDWFVTIPERRRRRRKMRYRRRAPIEFMELIGKSPDPPIMERRPRGEENTAPTQDGPGLAISSHKAVLDYHSYPHLVDHIASFVSFPSLVAWRGTCRRYRDRFDITTLRTSFRALPGGDECMMQVRTGGGHLVTEFSCRIPFRDFAIPLDDEQRRFKFRDPELQAMLASFIFKDLHVTGGCPHRPTFGEGWDEFEWTQCRPHSDVVYGLLSQRRHMPDYSYIGRGERRPQRRYRRKVWLSPDEHGALQFSEARRDLVFFLDNWKADTDPKNWVDPWPRVTDGPVHAKDRDRLYDTAGVWAFIVAGTERDVSLFNTPVPYRWDVLYDFSRCERPARTAQGGKRLASLMEHARKHILAGQDVILCGLEAMDPAWLDPTYPGDKAFANTSRSPRLVTYVQRLFAGGRHAHINNTPWPAFPAYIRERIAQSVPECSDVYSRIWVLPAKAAARIHYGMYEDGWGWFGTARLRTATLQPANNM